MSLNFCPKCGKKLESDSRICIHCGYDLSLRVKDVNKRLILADFTQRSFSWFIDMMIIILIVIPLSLYINFGYFYIYTNVYLFTIGFFYFFLFEYFNQGQTIGKFLLKIRSVDEKSFKKAKFTQYFLNNVSKATPFILIDLLLGIFVNHNSNNIFKKHFRITQNLSEISVIKLDK
jgi:hypothetical protein